MTGHMKGVSAVSVASTGDMTVSGSYDSTIKIWNTDVNSRYFMLNTMLLIIACCIHSII